MFRVILAGNSLMDAIPFSTDTLLVFVDPISPNITTISSMLIIAKKYG